MIKVLLVDDHELVRTGLKGILESVDGYQVIGEAETGEEALALTKVQVPDLILMDINMPGIGGLETTRKIRQFNPDIKVIVLTMHKEGPFPANMIRAGAKGYITKNCGVDETLLAISEVMNGKLYISNEVAQAIAQDTLTATNINPFDALSQRELQIMLMILQGLKVGDIADKLSLSTKTISTYRYRVFDKLKVKNESEMAQLAIKYNMTEQ
ncbi:MAG: response regulator [Gammaproteobacteria bacterium]|nr:response regulator [Gammaproteobacteria bacterium]